VASDGKGRYVVFFEADGSAAQQAAPSAADTLAAIRQKLVAAGRTAPAKIACLPRGSIPKTPSGKIQHRVIQTNLEEYESRALRYEEY
jgi:acyl-coenzyme A synthetase/AMP-(fatty) acid ligase